MTVAPQSIQPICATPPDDLIDLAGELELARYAFLNTIGTNAEELHRKRLADLLWNDKGTFALALRQAAEAAGLRSQVSELRAALEDLLGTFKSHVDGRDLLDELHPRHEIDIKVRKDGVERWYEGDWLSDVRDAAKRVRPVLDGALALNSQHSDGEAK